MSSPIIPTTPEGGLDAAAAAKVIVAAALKGTAVSTTPAEPAPAAPAPPVEPVTPGVTPPSEALSPIQPRPTEPVTPPVEPTPATPTPGAVTPADAAAVAADAGVPYADAVTALAEYGVVVETEGIPAELGERYGAMLESLRTVVAPVMAQDGKTRDALRRLDAFEQRLDKKPESVLLTLSQTKPEAFKRVAEIVEKARDDPEYAAQVVREIELEARESALVARESSSAEGEITRRGHLAEAATQSAAKRHGVDPAIADRFIAGMIGGTGATDFDVSSIDKLVAGLAPKVTVPAPPPIVTPEAAAATLVTPTAPAGGESPPAPPGISSGLVSDGDSPKRGGLFRSLIRNAGARVDKAMGQE